MTERAIKQRDRHRRRNDGRAARRNRLGAASGIRHLTSQQVDTTYADGKPAYDVLHNLLQGFLRDQADAFSRSLIKLAANESIAGAWPVFRIGDDGFVPATTPPASERLVADGWPQVEIREADPPPGSAKFSISVEVALRAASSNTNQIGKGLVAAYAASLVLAIVAEGERRGYAIFMRVAALSCGNRRWTDSMRFPVLHRPEELGTSLDGGECQSTFQFPVKRLRCSRQADPRL